MTDPITRAQPPAFRATHVQLYDRFMTGESVGDLAVAFSVDRDVIEGGIRARLAELARRAAEIQESPGRLAARALRKAAALTGCSLDQALNRRKLPAAVRARWIAWHALYDLGLTKNAIARAFGVDHTSISYALGAADEADLRPQIDAVLTHLRSIDHDL